MEPILYRRLMPCDCRPDLLDEFIRYQKVERCWRLEEGGWVLRDVSFIDDWTPQQRSRRVLELFEDGAVSFGAFRGSRLVGFSTLSLNRIGSRNHFMVLHFLHVSQDFRRQGIGKALLRLAADEALRLGAEKLYISSHSSYETQLFYHAAGCTLASEIDPYLSALEPFDVPLELILREN